MKISFIIPAYNSSNTIIRCLDSIYSLHLTDNEFEVIVIDDCSTDNSVQLIKHYAEKHSNLTLLCQLENHKQGAARNRGVQQAQGEYITFIDSDDLVLPDMISAIRLTDLIKADMIYSYMEIEKSNSMYFHKLDYITENPITGCEFAEKYESEGVFYYPPSYLYKKSFIDTINIPFIEDRQHEDRDWLAHILVNAESVIVAPYFTYRYTLNPNSTCHYPRYSTVFDHIASGIRHLDLSENVKNKCPKLSYTLRTFGIDEIYKSIRLKNLTKYSWNDNKQFLSNKFLMSLLIDLRRVCKKYDFPKEVYFIANYPHLMQIIVLLTSPIAFLIRKIKH